MADGAAGTVVYIQYAQVTEWSGEILPPCSVLANGRVLRERRE